MRMKFKYKINSLTLRGECGTYIFIDSIPGFISVNRDIRHGIMVRIPIDNFYTDHCGAFDILIQGYHMSIINHLRAVTVNERTIDFTPEKYHIYEFNVEGYELSKKDGLSLEDIVDLLWDLMEGIEEDD